MTVFGSSGRTRTYDQLINSQLLYQLSYRGIAKGQLTFFSQLNKIIFIAGFSIKPGCKNSQFITIIKLANNSSNTRFHISINYSFPQVIFENIVLTSIMNHKKI